MVILKAEPNPIKISDYGFFEKTTLSWKAEGVKKVELHLRSPGGYLLGSGGATGKVTTNKCINNGTVIYLQDVSDGQPLTEEHTLETITIHVYNARFTGTTESYTPNDIVLQHRAENSPGKTLITGWFSYEYGGTTAGDLMALQVAAEWLMAAGFSYDVALADLFLGGVNWQRVNPDDYTHLVFVCGPFSDYGAVISLLRRFSKLVLIGLNLSMLKSLDEFQPFNILFERDSSIESRPEFAFIARQTFVPVVGVIPVEPIGEYPKRAKHDTVNNMIRQTLSKLQASIVEIDTRLPNNLAGLRSPAEVESLIARMDLVITTRLHGIVLALKNGVPAIAIDPHTGGAKIRRQADTIGWPVVFNADEVTEKLLNEAFNYCLTDDAKKKAKQCSTQAQKVLNDVKKEFIEELQKSLDV